ncbi:RadC2 [Desulfamplus magnetovallimortis]|uniref:RadC2 n=1 Tax=Desulfamplus magnetovallimortis TaxID=1246637 RepID=A0A1W1HEE5_9BACT|nr:JAB domain-containing protein [Desulfamplus magnetovallimortis]SLM30867.1 RadC2 [Desulfamplus magnetovallimortis]
MKKNKNFISTFRVTLVRDQHVKFDQQQLTNSKQAQVLIKKVIETEGQPDREQFCVILLNSKNNILGLNIVATGDISSARVHPREVLKPAILANSASMILCHNHPSGDLKPSQDDKVLTRRIIQAADILGITVHEHLIISMYDDSYYSFADEGFIQEIYREIK